VKAGKESYRIVGAFDQFEYRHVAPLFRRLAEHFEYYVHGLNRVKSDLEVLREEQYQLGRRTFSTPEHGRSLGRVLWVGRGPCRYFKQFQPIELQSTEAKLKPGIGLEAKAESS